MSVLTTPIAKNLQSVQIQSKYRKNAGQNNSKYGYFLGSEEDTDVNY